VVGGIVWGLVGGIVGGIVLGDAVGETGTESEFPPFDKPGRMDSDELTLSEPSEDVAAMIIMRIMNTIPAGTKNLGLR